MEKDIETLMDKIAQKAATEAVAKIREFHKDDMKVLREVMGVRFDQVDSRFEKIESDIVEIKSDITEIKLDVVDIKSEIVTINGRLDRLEDVFSTFLREFKEDKEKVRQLEAQMTELTKRVSLLEAQLANQ